MSRNQPRDGLRPLDRLRRRPLLSFFLLAYLLSWAAWTPYVLSRNGLGVWHFGFPAVGGSSQLTGVLPGAYLGPIASALLLTRLTQGRRGVRAWARRMTRFRVGWRWYVGVLLAVPTGLAVAGTALSDRGPSMPPPAVLAAYLPGLILQMITTGLAEEPGWREFAMPRAQERFGPLPATILVGVLWGAWHLPLFLTDWGGGPHVQLTRVAAFMATTICFSSVMTWVFNRSGESMPLVMLLHTGVNNFFSVAWSDMFPRLSEAAPTYAFLLASLAAALVLLITTRGRLGYRTPATGPASAPPDGSGAHRDLESLAERPRVPLNGRWAAESGGRREERPIRSGREARG
ncbi:CPBP family intramembrane glutamic endopeptidase [Phaeacidiphilus oryzae]|uniref:CPBP family intramembrane glutamic endopeptidase n=1 Tax=Phaeacidiphilus oryzae TaxID=348818 RepID=UPI000A02365D|nr:type II CAAX endopeptidase family protein [Phaeacidiphilus oryzae]